MMKKLFIILSVIFLAGNLQDLHAEEIPFPEFYGVYVVADGRLIELKPIDVGFGGGQVGLKEIPKVEMMDNKAFIIVYKKGVEPTRWGLAKLMLVNGDVWVLERTIELKVAPIKSNQDMYRLAPDAPLAPGVYALPSGLFGKLSLTDPFGARLELSDRVQIFGSEAFVFTISGVLSSQDESTSPIPSSENPEEITIASLTKNMPDTNYFVSKESILNLDYDSVWDIAMEYLITDAGYNQTHFTMIDKPKGILLTKVVFGPSNTKSAHAILIEKITNDSSKITVKGFAWMKSSSGYWNIWKKESDHAIEVISKKANKKINKILKAKEKEKEKIERVIADSWKQVAQIPPPKRDWKELVTLKITGKYDDYSSLYLLGVNMRGLANDAFNSANKFLKKRDLTNAQKYANMGAKYYIESNNLFNTSEQIFGGSVGMTAQALEAVYRGTTEASKYGWLLTCGPKCYEVADYIFLLTDFAVDYSIEGMDEAQKNVITKAFVKTLLKMDGISGWIENRTSHLIGDSGLYNLMNKTIASPEFEKAFMKVLAESGVYATKKITEAEVKVVVENSLVFVKSSSNLRPVE